MRTRASFGSFPSSFRLRSAQARAITVLPEPRQVASKPVPPAAATCSTAAAW